MDEQTLKLLTDLHINNERQGPGSHESFMKMLELSGIDRTGEIKIADIGCGTGSGTIPLLQNTNARVTAVDFLPGFLEKLAKNAEAAGLSDRLTTIEANMSSLPFQPEQFDAIWAEGAIYNIGFETGIRDWKKYLKPRGVLVVSEITWLTEDTPEELKNHWEAEYPEVASASEKIEQLKRHGYELIDYFSLPEEDWLKNYYTPIASNYEDFLNRHDNVEAAKEIIAAEQKEVELYKKYKDYYSYGVYIARKIK